MISWSGSETTNLPNMYIKVGGGGGGTSVNGSVEEPRLVLVQFLVSVDLTHCSSYLNISIVSLGLQPLLMDLGAQENA